MFKFLKDKLKDTISNISEKIKKEAEDIGPEEPEEEEKPELDLGIEQVDKDLMKKPEKPEVPKEKPEKKEEKKFPEGVKVVEVEEPAKKSILGSLKEKFFHKKEDEEDFIEVKVKTEEAEEKPKVKKAPEVKVEEQAGKEKAEEPEEPEEKEEPEEEKEAEEEPEEVKEEEVKEAEEEEVKEELKEEEPKPAELKEEEEEKAEVTESSEEKKEAEEEEVKEELKEEEPKPVELKEEEEEKAEVTESSEEKKEAEEISEEEKEEAHAETKPEAPEEGQKAHEEKKGFFQQLKESVTMKRISESQFDDLFNDLEISLLENNVAVEVIDKIKDDLKNEIVDKPIRRGEIDKTILHTLEHSIEELFIANQIDLFQMIEQKKDEPFVICFLGINGSGKTTTIAKMAHMIQEKGYSVVLAAADTFRAAAIDQLQEHAERLKVPIIKHDYGSDPAAVAFDAIKHAKAKQIDVVLVDTAGRMHSNVNLTEEMKKIVRVANPDLKIFVGESITGNDCVEQAKVFDQAVSIDGIILSKADVDEKGGAAISVSYVTKKPIMYIGTGQEYDDIKQFGPEIVLDSLFSA